jgi:uncharacterized protein (TIGR04222 family)
MNSAQTDLYQRLQYFELDDPAHEFGFTHHLMKNQGWSNAYTQRAIAEYKKFAFLAVVADHQVVPSDQVDQVWHAHVLLTQSYWEEFCPQILQKKLHHHPARGGRAERAEFHQLYRQTIASYRQFFGAPPPDIWSPPACRFGEELKMQRVNLAAHWVIPKKLLRLPLPTLLRWPLMPLSLTLLTVGCVDVSQKLGLNQISAEQLFLWSLGLILSSGLGLGYFLQWPSEQPQQPPLDIYEIAYLMGGSARSVELAITQLVAQGYLNPNVRNRSFGIVKPLPATAPQLEQQVMQEVRHTPELKVLCQVVVKRTTGIRDRLVEKRLMIKGWAIFLLWAILVGAIYCVIFAGHSVYHAVTVSALEDVPIALLVLILAVKVILYLAPVPQTRWGRQIGSNIKKNHDVYDLAQHVAVHGVKVLSGGALDELKQMFAAVEEEAASSSCGGCGC